jgi:hypothetical protein
MGMRAYVGMGTIALTTGGAFGQWLPDYQVYSIQRIGLYGPDQTSLTGLQFSQADVLTTAGFVLGSSNRYVVDLNVFNLGNGVNTWVYNPVTNTTVQTGLTGPAYTGRTGFQISVNDFHNAAGQIAGFSRLITNDNGINGQNSWVYNPAINATVQTGLTSAAYTGSAGRQISVNQFQNAAGQVAGSSDRYLGVNTYNGRDTWVYNPAANTTVQTGLTGTAYTGSSGYQISVNDFQNDAGHIAGSSWRFTGVNMSNGADTWVYNPTTNTTVQTGLTGADYVGSAGYRASWNVFQNAAGQVAGTSQRMSGVESSRGRNTWVYIPATNSTVQIGLIGPANTGTAGYQFGRNNFQNAAGQVAGYSQRISGVNTDNGQNTWVYNPATNTTVQTGLIAAVHTGSAGYQVSTNQFQNATGQVAGYSQRISGVNTDNGQNTWVYNPATNTTVQTGLTAPANTGSAGYQFSSNNLQNAAGHAVGFSRRFTGVNTVNGQNTWVYNPTTNTTVQTGLTSATYTGSAGYQNSSSLVVNAAGQVAGVSQRVTGVNTDNGQNAWVYNPTTNTTLQVGLVDAAHTGSAGYQNSTTRFQNAAGQLAGTSLRITGVDTFNGVSAWVYNPATNTTTQTGLTAPANTGSAGYQNTHTQFQNAAGQLAGTSLRIIGVDTNNGVDAWYFDPATGLTHALIGSVRTSDNAAYSLVQLLTEDGFVLGSYGYFADGVGTGEDRAFIFRPDLGFTDLGNLVAGGLTANGWSTLRLPAFFDALRTVVGYGYVNGQTSELASASVFVMRAPLGCNSIDFNGDGVFPDALDLIDFLTVLAGGTCSTGSCDSIDFNNDGVFPSDGDVEAFFRVLAGGSC